MKAAFQAHLNEEFEAGKEFKPNKADWLDGRWSTSDREDDEYYQRGQTSIKPETLAEVGNALTTRARRLSRCTRPSAACSTPRRKMFETGEGLRLGHRRGAGLRLFAHRRLPGAPGRSGRHPRHVLAAPFRHRQPGNRRALLSR